MFDPMKVEHFTDTIVLMLQAFADGAVGGEGGSGTGVGASEPAAQGKESAHSTGGTEGSGERAPTTAEPGEGAPDTGTPTPDYDKEFKEFMKRPEMKQRMDDQKRRAVFARFRENASKESESQEITKALAARYGVSATDHKAILEALKADDRYEAEQAEAAGMDLATFRELNGYRARSLEETARREAEEGARQSANLRVEAQRLQSEFPDFDPEIYMADDRFKAMVNNGASMREAYVAMNLDSIMSATAKYAAEKAAKEAEARVAEAVRQNLARPAEGGADGGKPTAGEQKDFKNMSSADFKAYRNSIFNKRE